MSAQIEPSDSSEDADLRSLFPGDSELARRMRAFDWSSTPLGAPQRWPENLRIAVRICLTSRFPMHVWWGPSLTLFYNDAYISFLGPVKHPAVLGRSGREAWSEIWDTIGPMIDDVFTHASANWSEDILMFFDREIPKEEVYVTFSFSPILGAQDKVEGMFCACTETTEKLVGNRRLETLRKLGVEAAITRTVDQACAAAVAVLGENARDIPFAAVYLVDAADGKAHLAHTVGLAQPHPLPPAVSPDDTTSAPLPLASVLKTKQATESGEVCVLGVPLPGGPWPEPVRNVMVLPIHTAAHALGGLLVAGVSSRRPLDASYRTFYDLVAGHIGAAIAEAKAYEEEKRRAEALAQLDRAKTAFFSNISHEFRTPLTLMLGPTEDALSSPERALRGAQLETVHRNELRLLRLVNTLLDFARAEAGREQAVYQATDLAVLTTDLASTFRSAVERGGLQLRVDCPPLPQPVYVDRAMWEKIVLNLLSNAFKHTFEGDIRVTLRAVEGRAELEVRDTGVGIPEHELPRVFERFHRVEGTRARTHEGSGIGLALVHDLVQLHGGTIGVASRVGEGTAFTVSIPLGTAALPAEGVSADRELPSRTVNAELYVAEALRWISEPPQDASASLLLFPPTARVLVVDDNADMRDYMVRLLQPHWEVHAVSDGMQALAAIRGHRPDLIVTDVMMPNLDGFQLLRALRDDLATARIPVIILSARAGEELRVQGLLAGADDYLVKPFSAKELVARVATHLELSRLRRQAETERDRFRSLLSQVPAVVNFLKGPDLVFELAHPLTVKFLGGRELQGKRLLDVIPEIRDQPYYELLQRVLRTGEPASGEESLARFDQSNTGVLEDSYWNYVYLPVYGANGEVEGVMTFDIEVTDQVRARRRNEALMEELKASDRRKDEFLAMLAHELRNPLAPLRTSMYIVRKQLGSAPVNRHLDVIERQAGNLARIVDDLLDVSRITRGKIELRKERVDIAQAVTRALEATGQFIESRKHEVSVSLPLRPIDVQADPVRLDQIVTNLLTNAAKYTDPGGRIWVSVERAGEMAELRVRDNGVGIAEDLRPHLFDLFQQGSRDLSRTLGGLGIGLTIVRNLVELHGGTVEALSEGAGKGSEFVVRLPYIKEVDTSVESPALTAAASRAVDRAGQEAARRVLVVDDNKDAAESLADLIRLLGHDVRVALDGPSAIEVTEQWHPDLLFLDIGLPGMDGYQVAGRLRGKNASGPLLVALTGYGQESDRRKTREAGFNEHLVKPPDIAAIENILEASMEHIRKPLH